MFNYRLELAAVGNSEITKDKIIENTVELIKENDRDTDKITIRRIAERSGISIGLVNHYFASKDKLIETCVQKIISGVIHSFDPGNLQNESGPERLKRIAKEVTDFLMLNPQISRISMLDDLTNPRERDNTMGTVMGFSRSLSGDAPDESDVINAFMLTAVIQGSFLRKDILKMTLGVDFYNKTERDVYLDRAVDKLLNKGGN